MVGTPVTPRFDTHGQDPVARVSLADVDLMGLRVLVLDMRPLELYISFKCLF
jgi:hypothetical protein